MSKLKRPLILLAIVILLGFVVKRLCEIFSNPIHTSGKATIASRFKEYGDVVKKRLEPDFRSTGVPYPPARVVLVGLKDERKLEVYAAGSTGPLRFIRSGVVEAGCRTVVGQRLKQSGMFWSSSGTQNVLAIRSARLSNRFDHYWDELNQSLPAAT